MLQELALACPCAAADVQVTANADSGVSTSSLLFQLASALWAVAVVPLSLLLLVVARTWDGRLFAVAALLTGLGPFVIASAWVTKRGLWRRLAAYSGAVWLITACIVLWSAPAGPSSTKGRVAHVYADGRTKLQRYALGNLLPEVDQLMLGFTIMPAFDSLLTNSQASRLKGVTAAVYAEMDRDPDFRALGSVMPEAYDEILGLPFDRGHCYVYVPARVDRSQPSPVLVFFHGSGGCFKGYLWVLSKVADRVGCIVVAPSHGCGNWQAAESETALQNALACASRLAAVDRHRIHLAGLSNGGLAVSQLAGAEGSQFRSLIFLSPVFDTAEISRRSFGEQCHGQAVFVMTGERDDRMPLDYVGGNIAEMARADVAARLRTVSDADHFLVFSHRALVIDSLDAWLQENSGGK